jgi:hypothetical protein
MAIVVEFGKYLSTITYYGNKVLLYVVEDQFVEVFYDDHENQIIQVEILAQEHDRLSLYAEAVDLSDLAT